MGGSGGQLVFCLPKGSMVVSERGMFLHYENPFLTKIGWCINSELDFNVRYRLILSVRIMQSNVLVRFNTRVQT